MLVPNRMFRNDARQALPGRDDRRATSATSRRATPSPSATSTTTATRTSSSRWAAPTWATRRRSALYRNPGSANTWIGLELEGVRSNRRAVGARLTLSVDSPVGPRTIHRTSAPAAASAATRCARRSAWARPAASPGSRSLWPATGLKQRVTGLSPGRRYRIREGAPEGRRGRLARQHRRTHASGSSCRPAALALVPQRGAGLTLDDLVGGHVSEGLASGRSAR